VVWWLVLGGGGGGGGGGWCGGVVGGGVCCDGLRVFSVPTSGHERGMECVSASYRIKRREKEGVEY